MIVCVLWVLDGVLDKLDECFALTHELNELRDTATAAKHGELLLLKKKLFDGAALFLVEELLDLHVASIRMEELG